MFRPFSIASCSVSLENDTSTAFRLVAVFTNASASVTNRYFRRSETGVVKLAGFLFVQEIVSCMVRRPDEVIRRDFEGLIDGSGCLVCVGSLGGRLVLQ